MRAAWIDSPKQWKIRTDAPEPVLRDGNIIVKLERWSVCGSDIRNEFGPIHPEHRYPIKLGKPGHECAGVVVETKSLKFKVGQRVIVIPTPDGVGGFVDYIEALPDRTALLPDEGDLTGWLMCQPSGTVLYAVQRIGTIIGKSVLVIGQGAIGQSFTAICSRLGAKQVIAADLYDYRLERSKKFGATHTVNASKEDMDKCVRELTGGRMPDIVVEAAGYPETLNASIRLVGKFGRIMMFGVQEGGAGHHIKVDTHPLMNNEATIIPAAAARSGDPIGHIETMIQLRRRGWWDPAEMITHHMKFNDIQKAFEMYERREDNMIKVVMS
ncbi:MAG: zinc-binding dehydrogenase [SAR202 cluster bacterium]|nr:zinc-binding dehydrogenase [SAR202 cluster bacterium]